VRSAAKSVTGCSLIAAVWLSGCTVGPSYRQPQIAAPPAYVEAVSTARTVVSAGDSGLSGWWAQFDDPTLTGLIDRALASSPTLEAATSRIREARLKEIETAAVEYPNVNAIGSAVTLRSNGESGSSGGGSTSSGSGGSGLVIPSRLNLYSAGFDASWEADLFGATRRAMEEATANTEANVWAKRDGEVSLTAEIANDYLMLRALQARISVGNAELERQKDLFVLIQARRTAGFVTNLDVNQQTTLVATAAAQIPQLEAEARVRIHSLGVLLGEPPEALEHELVTSVGAIPRPPPTLPLGLPSELLLRRPDIREAERRLAASNAAVGVKTAVFYPKINLIGFVGFAGLSLGDLFSGQNFLTAALGMASEPVFDAGRNRATLAEAKEERTQAELAYRIAVLGALRDVEDALARYQAEETRRESLLKSVSAADGTLAIAQDQYHTGFVTFINVLQAQYALLNAEDQLTQSDALVVTDLVAIYKALGGGWST